jgi:HK97 gp10 family phage protein
MKTLSDVASLIRTLAQTNLTSGPTRAYKTGNLFRQIGAFNTVNRMISKSGNRSKITLFYSPTDAYYGKFVEKGTYKMKARPFAGNAVNDPQVQKAISEYQNSVVDEINNNLFKQISVSFKSLGKKK